MRARLCLTIRQRWIKHPLVASSESRMATRGFFLVGAVHCLGNRIIAREESYWKYDFVGGNERDMVSRWAANSVLSGLNPPANSVR